MDRPFCENNLAREDLLLEWTETTSREDDSINAQIEVVCSNYNSHTQKLLEGI